MSIVLAEINLYFKRPWIKYVGKTRTVGTKFSVYGKIFIDPSSVISIFIVKDDSINKDFYLIRTNDGKSYYTDQAGKDALAS